MDFFNKDSFIACTIRFNDVKVFGVWFYSEFWGNFLSIVRKLKNCALKFYFKINAVTLTHSELNFSFLPLNFGGYVAKTLLFKVNINRFLFLNNERVSLSTLPQSMLEYFSKRLVLLHSQLEKSQSVKVLLSLFNNDACLIKYITSFRLRFSMFIVYKFIVSIPSR